MICFLEYSIDNCSICTPENVRTGLISSNYVVQLNFSWYCGEKSTLIGSTVLDSQLITTSPLKFRPFPTEMTSSLHILIECVRKSSNGFVTEEPFAKILVPLEDLEGESTLEFMKYSIHQKYTVLEGCSLKIVAQKLLIPQESSIPIRLTGEARESTVYNNRWYGECVPTSELAASINPVSEEVQVSILPQHLDLTLLSKFSHYQTAVDKGTKKRTSFSISAENENEFIIAVYENQVRRSTAEDWLSSESIASIKFSNEDFSRIYPFDNLELAAPPRKAIWLPISNWQCESQDSVTDEHGWKYLRNLKSLESLDSTVVSKSSSLLRRRKWSRRLRISSNDITRGIELLDTFGEQVSQTSLADNLVNVEIDGEKKFAQVDNQPQQSILQGTRKESGHILIKWNQILSVEVISPSICSLTFALSSQNVAGEPSQKTEMILFISNCLAQEIRELVLERLKFSKYRQLYLKLGASGGVSGKDGRDIASDLRNLLQVELEQSEKALEKQQELVRNHSHSTDLDEIFSNTAAVNLKPPVRVKLFQTLLLDLQLKAQKTGKFNLEEAVEIFKRTFPDPFIPIGIEHVPNTFIVYISKAKEQLTTIISALGNNTSPEVIHAAETVINGYVVEIIALFTPYLANQDKMSSVNPDQLVELICLLIKSDTEIQEFLKRLLVIYGFEMTQEINFSSILKYPKLFTDFIHCHLLQTTRKMDEKWSSTCRLPSANVTELLLTRLNPPSSSLSNRELNSTSSSIIQQMIRSSKDSTQHIINLFRQTMKYSKDSTASSERTRHCEDIISNLELSYSTSILHVLKLYLEKLLSLKENGNIADEIPWIVMILQDISYISWNESEWQLTDRSTHTHKYLESIEEIHHELLTIQMLGFKQLSSLLFAQQFKNSFRWSSISSSPSCSNEDHMAFWKNSSLVSQKGFLFRHFFSDLPLKDCLTKLSALNVLPNQIIFSPEDSIDWNYVIIQKLILLYSYHLLLLAWNAKNEITPPQVLQTFVNDGIFLLDIFSNLTFKNFTAESDLEEDLVNKSIKMSNFAKKTELSMNIIRSIHWLLLTSWAEIANESKIDESMNELLNIASTHPEFSYAIIHMIEACLAIKGVRRHVNSIRDRAASAETRKSNASADPPARPKGPVKQSSINFLGWGNKEKKPETPERKNSVNSLPPGSSPLSPPAAPAPFPVEIYHDEQEEKIIESIENLLESIHLPTSLHFNCVHKYCSLLQIFSAYVFHLPELTQWFDIEKEFYQSYELEIKGYYSPIILQPIRQLHDACHRITISDLKIYHLLYLIKMNIRNPFGIEISTFYPINPLIKIQCEYYLPEKNQIVLMEHETMKIQLPEDVKKVKEDKLFAWFNQNFEFLLPHKSYELMNIHFLLFYEIENQKEFIGSTSLQCLPYSQGFNRKNHFMKLQYRKEIDHEGNSNNGSSKELRQNSPIVALTTSTKGFIDKLKQAVEEALEEERPLTELSFSIITTSLC